MLGRKHQVKVSVMPPPYKQQADDLPTALLIKCDSLKPMKSFDSIGRQSSLQTIPQKVVVTNTKEVELKRSSQKPRKEFIVLKNTNHLVLPKAINNAQRTKVNFKLKRVKHQRKSVQPVLGPLQEDSCAETKLFFQDQSPYVNIAKPTQKMNSDIYQMLPQAEATLTSDFCLGSENSSSSFHRVPEELKVCIDAFKKTIKSPVRVERPVLQCKEFPLARGEQESTAFRTGNHFLKPKLKPQKARRQAFRASTDMLVIPKKSFQTKDYFRIQPTSQLYSKTVSKFETYSHKKV